MWDILPTWFLLYKNIIRYGVNEMSKNIIKTRKLAGFKELIPKEQEIFNDIVDKITEK